MKKLGQQIPITMYNRLLRAFLSSYDDIEEEKGLMKAKEIVQVIHDQHRLPTTRTYTYMIQAYLKRNDLDRAKHYVALLHRYSLDKFKTSFDCSIMMRYYIQSGDTYAKDFLWRDIQRHADMIQPGPNLFTIYVESLLSASHLSHEMIADVARSFVHHFYQSTTTTTAIIKENNNNNIHFTQHQLSIWLKVVRLLTQSENNKDNDFYCTDAESLLLCLIQLTNNHHQLQNTNNNDTFLSSSSIKKQGIMAVQDIFHIYLQKAQDVKVLAFYYKLRKSGVKEDVFGKELTNTIGNVLKKIEVKQQKQQQQQRDNDDHYNHKALLEEFGLTLKPT
ncbi:unnamed protein product [Cunninghamella echinulata]